METTTICMEVCTGETRQNGQKGSKILKTLDVINEQPPKLSEISNNLNFLTRNRTTIIFSCSPMESSATTLRTIESATKNKTMRVKKITRKFPNFWRIERALFCTTTSSRANIAWKSRFSRITRRRNTNLRLCARPRRFCDGQTPTFCCGRFSIRCSTVSRW